MDTNTPPTVDMSLGAVDEAVGKAAADLLAAQRVIARTRLEIASANTSLSRGIVTAAEQIITSLKDTDVALDDLLRKLSERD